ncbi:MAG: RES family NAD+ phosphorylase [Thermomicrobiales bacterium]
MIVDSLPLPPPDLDAWALPIVEIAPEDARFFRCHRHPGPYRPTSYNAAPVADRFNASDGAYGVLYLGFGPEAAFIETFGSVLVGAAPDLRAVTSSTLSQRCLCEVRMKPGSDPLRLVDLATGHGTSRLSADGRISTSKDRDATRAWARALWSHPACVHGIRYRACNDLEQMAAAVFDRTGDVFQSGCDRMNRLREPDVLASLLDRYAIGLIVDD